MLLACTIPGRTQFSPWRWARDFFLVVHARRAFFSGHRNMACFPELSWPAEKLSWGNGVLELGDVFWGSSAGPACGGRGDGRPLLEGRQLLIREAILFRIYGPRASCSGLGISRGCQAADPAEKSSNATFPD